MTRLKREECERTKHDSVFSQWKILIGPNDWKNYSMCKDGTERYRIHNLPITCSCPGLYELGIAASHSDLGRDIGKLGHNRIIVVYVGQAENVRTRLQHYGRAGSHLDNGNSFGFPDDCNGFGFQKGPGLFREIFSRGFPIVFRWTQMENKKEAEKAEALLLRTFDYAWNKGGNGVRRANDILFKLDEIISNSISVTTIGRKFQQWMWHHSFGKKKVGIRIKVSTHSTETESTSSTDPGGKDLRSRIFKLGRSQPSLVRSKCTVNDEELITVGSVAFLDESVIGISARGEKSVVCGVVFQDGSVCMEEPVHGRKRCVLHKGMRISNSISRSRAEGKTIVCGVGLGDGMTCMETPVKGRKRCELHVGMRVNTSSIP